MKIWPNEVGTPTRLKSTTTFGYTNGNRLTYASGTVTSNSQGEPLSHNGNNCTWSYGKLSNVETSQGIYTYLYNAYGQRTRKTYQCKTIGTGVYVRNSNGNYTYDNNGRLISESGSVFGDEPNNVKLRYLYGSTGVVGCLFTIGGTTTEYSYLRNEKGDVVAVYNASGTKVGSYAYDAYGNCTVNSTNEFVTTYNPIRYRGYYCDLETGFYYCNTRYYNPFWCRWISMDSTSYADIQSVDGLNLFAYCNNDPVNFVDPSGQFPWLVLGIAALALFTPLGGTAAQLAVSTISYVGMVVASIWDQDIRDDLTRIHWNPFNADEQLVLLSTKVSFYKGMPVYRTKLNRSGTFYAMFLRQGESSDTVKHERGHGWQSMMMGIGTYAFTVGIPSPLMLGTWNSYHDSPWEAMADILGGVQRPLQTTETVNRAWAYYALSMFNPLAVTLFWFK